MKLIYKVTGLKEGIFCGIFCGNKKYYIYYKYLFIGIINYTSVVLHSTIVF